MLPARTAHRNKNTIEPPETSTLAVYIHIPFCQTRCTYCAFNTYTGLSHLVPAYVAALQRELQLVQVPPATPLDSIYFGGGTPSLLPIHDVANILETCAAVFELVPGAEISVEANPGTVNQDYLAALHALGVNRLSIGMQTAHASELQMFGRTHLLDEVRAAVVAARQAGFDNLNLDLIYGIPHQTLARWRTSLETALALNPDHLSLYSLSLEDATPLLHRATRGGLPHPDPDLAAEMYDWASDRLAEAGYIQYEISNWSRPGLTCRHNVHVWRNLPYLGIGAGAHGCAGATRYANILRPADYIARIQDQPAALPFPLTAASGDIIHLEPDDVITETVILGLRLVQEGIHLDDFAARFGSGLGTIYGPQLAQLQAWGLLEQTPDRRIRLTSRARLIANRVFAEFI